jgi:hypothetical protein
MRLNNNDLKLILRELNEISSAQYYIDDSLYGFQLKTVTSTNISLVRCTKKEVYYQIQGILNYFKSEASAKAKLEVNTDIIDDLMIQIITYASCYDLRHDTSGKFLREIKKVGKYLLKKCGIDHVLNEKEIFVIAEELRIYWSQNETP